MIGRPPRSAWLLTRRAVTDAAEIFWRQEPAAHFHWRFGLLVGGAVAAALAAGAALGNHAAAVVAALAVWFVALGVPPRTAAGRCGYLGRRTVLLIAATALGVAVGGAGAASSAAHLATAAAGVAALALLIPVPGVTVTPLITFIMALAAPPGLTPAVHIAAFAVAAVAAAVVLLLPAAASPVAVEFRGLELHHPVRRLHANIGGATPEFRYAVQAAVTVTATYVLLTVAHWPHAGWVLVGILTTLRQSWSATASRVVKRSIGMVGGSALTALLLPLSACGGYWTTVVLVAVCAALARPLRQFNYGLWPIFGTPVLLLITNLGQPLALSDAGIRLGNNLIGAAVTLCAVVVVWPHPTQRPRRARQDSPRPLPNAASLTGDSRT